MVKAIVQVGYDHYVMDAQDALIMHELLSKAECFRRQYRGRDDGGPLYHVWEQDNTTDTRSFEILPDNLYRMAKLAGKPEDK